MIGEAAAPDGIWLTRLPAGPKLGGLVAAGVGFFLVGSPWIAAALALGSALVLRSTGRPLGALARDLAWTLAAIAFIAAATAAFDDPMRGLVSLFRLSGLVFLAHAVTLTTRTPELMAVIEAVLAPLDRRGLVDAGRVSLTITLAIRFIPVIFDEAREIRDAQAARGLGHHPLALVVPLAVRVLTRAEIIAEAIEARGFDRPRKTNTPDPKDGRT